MSKNLTKVPKADYKPSCRHPKAKGSAYERKVCKRLSLWVSNFRRTDVFWRSASSGGRFTQTTKRNLIHGRSNRRHGIKAHTDDAHAGDICLTHESGKDFIRNFVVECKHNKDLDVQGLVFNGQAKILQFWKQALDQCTRGREPLLIGRQNRRIELVFTTERGLRLLKFGGKLRITGYFPLHGIYAIPFNDVLALSFKRIKAVLRKAYKVKHKERHSLLYDSGKNAVEYYRTPTHERRNAT